MRRGTRGPTRAGRGTCPRSRSTGAHGPFGRRCADGRRRGAPALGRRAPRGGGGAAVGRLPWGVERLEAGGEPPADPVEQGGVAGRDRAGGGNPVDDRARL